MSDEKARVLVVANKTAGSEELVAAMRERAERGPAEFVLLVPATPGGMTHVIDPHEREQGADVHCRQAAERLREAGLPVVEAKAGDAEPLAAVEDELNSGGDSYDEIIVSTLPKHLSKWLKLDLPSKVRGLTDSPVTHVTAHKAKVDL
jgi:hypothetical protein